MPNLNSFLADCFPRCLTAVSAFVVCYSSTSFAHWVNRENNDDLHPLHKDEDFELVLPVEAIVDRGKQIERQTMQRLQK